MLSAIDLASVCGGQGRAATPAEAAQTDKDAAAYAADHPDVGYAPSVQPAVGGFWTGRRKYD